MGAAADLTGTLWPLILPMLLGDAFSIFLLRQFLLTIPRSTSTRPGSTAAASWRTLLRVVLPMARPGIAAAALFQFFYCWNDYYGPLLYTSENPSSLDPLARAGVVPGAAPRDWNLTMAATVLVMAPGDPAVLLRPEGLRRRASR